MPKVTSSWLAAAGATLAAICAHAQPSAEDARLRAQELAALVSICAQAKPGDALAPVCGLPAAEAVALAEAAEAVARARLEAEARKVPPIAELIALHRAEQSLRPRRTPKRTPTDRDLWLIAPPGFGPTPEPEKSTPAKSAGP
jgi:hypothetical protein